MIFNRQFHRAIEHSANENDCVCQKRGWTWSDLVQRSANMYHCTLTRAELKHFQWPTPYSFFLAAYIFFGQLTGALQVRSRFQIVQLQRDNSIFEILYRRNFQDSRKIMGGNRQFHRAINDTLKIPKKIWLVLCLSSTRVF